MKNKDYSKISTYFKENRGVYSLTAISGLLFDGLNCFIPILTGYVINSFQAQMGTYIIVRYAVYLLLSAAFIQLNRFLKRYYVREFANRIVYKMREVSYHNLLDEEAINFNTISKADIMNRNLADIKDTAEAIRKVTTEVFDSFVLMTGYIVSLFVLDWKITLYLLVFIGLSILFAELMKKVIYKTSKKYKKKYSEIKSVFQETVENEIYYRGMGVEDNFDDSYVKSQESLQEITIENNLFKGSFEPLYKVVSLIGVLPLMYLCIRNVVDGKWLIGTLSTYLSTYILVSTKASKVGKVFNAYQNGKVSWQRCKEFLKLYKVTSFNQISNERGDFVVRNLSFGYTKDFIVHNVSFILKQGQVMGLCGSVHTGKSTLGAGLSGLYKYEGSCTLNGIEVRDLAQNSESSNIVFVSSKSEIFSDSLSFNIGFGDCSQVNNALELSGLKEDIDGGQLELEKVLSHSLVNLSTGQQKRLMIARAYASKAKVVILDNPFSATDINDSLKILKNMKDTSKTSIVINNQKAILSQCNLVFFLTKDGYEVNTYDNLLQNKNFLKLIGGGK